LHTGQIKASLRIFDLQYGHHLATKEKAIAEIRPKNPNKNRSVRLILGALLAPMKSEKYPAKK
jgi:hypothetical protein